MRRVRELFAIALLGLTVAGTAGLRGIEATGAKPLDRTEEMLIANETLRELRDEWRKYWYLDQPSHMTYQRVHGGIGP